MNYLKMNKIILSVLSFTFLLSHAWAADPTQDTVEIKLDDNVKVRRTKKTHSKQVLISDTTLPAGAVIEVSQAALKAARNMEYWEGEQSSELPFVKGVKIISAPGFSKGEIRELNAINEDDGLYVAKSFVDHGRSVVQDKVKRQVEIDEVIPLYYRADTAVKSSSQRQPPPAAVQKAQEEEQKKEDNIKAAQRTNEIIEKIAPIVQKAGTGGCTRCEVGMHPVQKILSQGVPQRALTQALDYFDKHQDIIKNKNYVTITDYTALSGEKRMFIINMNTGDVEKLYAAHGKGSDPSFSNHVRSFYQIGKDSPVGSHKTPGGFHLADFYPSPAHQYKSLLLAGLEAKNSDSASRYIEIHGAKYVNDSYVRGGSPGRSYGCSAIAMDQIDHVIKELRGKSLVYNYDGT